MTGFNRLLDHRFPVSEIGGRTVVVLDYGWTGQSLKWGTHYLQDWATLNDHVIKFKTLLFIEPSPGSKTRFINGRRQALLNAKDNPNLAFDFTRDMSEHPNFGAGLNESKYDKYAYYSTFQPWEDDPESVQVNAIYANVQNEFKNRYESAMCSDLLQKIIR